nr:L,D-transpeptidase family protein [Roseibium limicola]
MGGALTVAVFLAGCQADELGYGPKAQRPVSQSVARKMQAQDMPAKSPILIRIFKEESKLEVWKQKRNGRFEILEDFDICKWSGELGPKFKEGDRQAPEGFYEITPGLMNPNSSYHLSFNLGYPNSYDRSHGRTGSHLMVHGACSSRGCYAMTDAQVQDIYALARDSFKGGQRSFQVQAFPFKMTAENMAKHHDSEHIDFWRMLKTGYDHFELTHVPPKVDVCEKKYVFDATPVIDGVPFRATAQCPAYEVPPRLAQLVDKKQREDDQKFEQIVAKLEAREERDKRWKERQTTIAGFVSGGTVSETATDATAEVPAMATAPGQIAAPTGSPAQSPIRQPNGSPIATAFAPAPSPQPTNNDGTGGFLKRFIPFGFGNEETPQTTSVVDGETNQAMTGAAPETIPAAKPE